MGIIDWFKSQMFGAKIVQTVGSVEGTSSLLFYTDLELKVHILEGKNLPNSRLIGIEIVAKSALGCGTTPITLSKAEAQRLIGLLNSAIQ